MNALSPLRPFGRPLDALQHLLPREGPTVLLAQDERTSEVAMLSEGGSWQPVANVIVDVGCQ